MTLFFVKPFEPRSLQSWANERAEIDFAPVYQREGNIWGLALKQRLVDTVLNGFDIPKLYLADFTRFDSPLNTGRRRYAVIDGKQRLEALFQFLDGQFQLAREFILYENPTLELGGLTYWDLASRHSQLAERFSQYELAMMAVVTDEEARINELFLRLNTSKPLTGAERRNAMLGEVPRVIRELAQHDFWTRVRYNSNRGQTLNVVAKLLLLEHAGAIVDTKKSQLDRLATDPDWIARRERVRAALADPQVNPLLDNIVETSDDTESTNILRSAERVQASLDRLAPLFREKDPLLAQQALIPVLYLIQREIEPDHLSSLRPFILRFQKDREENRRLVDEADRDPELTHFELLTRTSNDQASIEGRYRVMLSRFLKFQERQFTL